jgi:hypothetical protein
MEEGSRKEKAGKEAKKFREPERERNEREKGESEKSIEAENEENMASTMRLENSVMEVKI